MKRSKYNNIKTTIDDIKFDSKKEAKRYGELKLLERAVYKIKRKLMKAFHDIDVFET